MVHLLTLVTVSGGESSDEEEFQRTTTVTLSTRATPLGTMTETQIENSLAAIRYWLSPGVYLPSAYDVLKADRLLQRLVAELSCSTVAARQYTETLAETHPQVSYVHVIWMDTVNVVLSIAHALFDVPFFSGVARFVFFRILLDGIGTCRPHFVSHG